MTAAALPMPGRTLPFTRGRVAAAAIGLSIFLNGLPLAWRWGGVVVDGGPLPPRAEPLQTRIIPAPAAAKAVAAIAEAVPAQSSPLLPPAADPPAREQSTPSPLPATAVAPPSALVASAPAVTARAIRTDPAPSAEPAAPPGYLKTSELSRAAQPLGEIVPDYPLEAARRAGVVTLQLFIDEHGRVEHADVVGAEPPGVFDLAAQAAFLKARFEPARLGSSAVRSQMTVEVDFKPPDRNSSTTSRGY